MVWHLTKSALERWTEKLLHVHDTPERTAAAFAMGVAIGFSPFLGLHTAIGLALAFALNLNRVAALIGQVQAAGLARMGFVAEPVSPGR